MTRPFADYDTRHYPTLDVRAGYAEWAPNYDRSMDERIDMALLNRLCLPLAGRRVVDLGCGTGRLGLWASAHGARHIDGVDQSPDMQRYARGKNVYRNLVEASILSAALPKADYDVALCGLVACHVADLAALYRAAFNLLDANGEFVLLDFHPHFMQNGIPTHDDRADGGSVAIENPVHLFEDHMAAGRSARLVDMVERTIDDEWVAAVPSLTRHLGKPVTFAMRWRLT